MSTMTEGVQRQIEKDERKAEKREAKKRALLMRRINEQVQTIRIQAIGLVLAFAVFLALSSSLNADILRRFLSLVDPVPLGLRTADEEKFRSYPIQVYMTYAIQAYPTKCSYRISNTCGHLYCLGTLMKEALSCLESNDTIIYHHEPSQFDKYDLPKAMLESRDENFWFDKNNVLTQAAVLIFRRLEKNDFHLEKTVVAWKDDCQSHPTYDTLIINSTIFDKDFRMSDEPTAVIWFNKYDRNKIFLISPRQPATIQRSIQLVHKMHNQLNYVLALHGERRPLQKAVSFLVRKHLYNDFYETAIRYQQRAYYDFIESKYQCEKNSDIAHHLKAMGIVCDEVELNDVEEEDVFYSFILYHPPTQSFFTYENTVMVDGV